MSRPAAHAARYWAVNALAALAILLVLGVHMGLIHLDGLLAQLNPAFAEPLAWENVVKRGASLGFTLSYVLLVATGLFHGLYGLHTILTEVWSSPRARSRIAAACWVIGVLLFAVGTAAVLVFHARTAGA